MMDNRRRHLRIPIVSVAHVTAESIGEETDVIVRDISIEGMGGYTKIPFRKGDVLQVKLKLTTPEKEVIEEVISGEIRWSTQVDKGKRHAIGILFRDLETHNKRLFAYLLELIEIFRPE